MGTLRYGAATYTVPDVELSTLAHVLAHEFIGGTGFTLKIETPDGDAILFCTPGVHLSIEFGSDVPTHDDGRVRYWRQIVGGGDLLTINAITD